MFYAGLKQAKREREGESLGFMENLTLTLALDSKNHKLINSFEKKLSNLDLVAKYSIYKFSNERVIYKIVYNNSPNKFIEEIISSGFNIDNSSAIWKIK